MYFIKRDVNLAVMDKTVSRYHKKLQIKVSKHQVG